MKKAKKEEIFLKNKRDFIVRYSPSFFYIFFRIRATGMSNCSLYLAIVLRAIG